MMYSLIIPLIAVYCVFFASAVRQRCSSPRFSCQFNNPCDPLCEEGQFYYPGRSDITYVQCVNGECTEQRCPRRTAWNQDHGRCEGGNGLEDRCAFGSFDCDDLNPCSATLCEQGVLKYPGPSPRRYVSCVNGCSKELCPRRQVWNQATQRCVRKNRPIDPAVNRCGSGIYDCEDHNPCDPERCIHGQIIYKSSDGKVVVCTPADNTCQIWPE